MLERMLLALVLFLIMLKKAYYAKTHAGNMGLTPDPTHAVKIDGFSLFKEALL